MESIDYLRFASLCVLLAGVETLHGIARTVLLAPRVGKVLATKLSVVSGTLLAFGVWCLPFLRSRDRCYRIGLPGLHTLRCPVARWRLVGLSAAAAYPNFASLSHSWVLSPL